MGFEFYKESYAGAIREISIGDGSKAITVGGETCYSFYQFEGDMPHKPKIAMEVWDTKPLDWPEAAISCFKDVIDDPVAWAKKCVDDYGAEVIALQLKSIDPNGLNATPDDVSVTVKKVLAAVDVPLIVWGVANAEKDAAVFKKIAESCQDSSLILGPVEDKNHKAIGAAAMGYGHLLVSSSPIDVNLAKQVNILLENLGMPMDRVLIDPTTGGLGYGLEYAYSVMERLRMAAMIQGDDKLQMPIVNNLGNEIWKCKEVKQSIEDAPLLGDPEKRGVLMEAVGAIVYLMAGSDLLIMRHPESIRLVKSYIDLLMNGGNGLDIASIEKHMAGVSVDLLDLSPAPDLTVEEEKSEKKSVVGRKSKTSTSETGTAPKKKVKVEKPERKVTKSKIVEAQSASKDKLTKTKINETKAAEDREEAKAQAAVEAKEAEVKKAAAEAREAEVREAEEAAIRNKRAIECAKIADGRVKVEGGKVTKMTPALEQREDSKKILDKLQWVHRRVALYKW